MPDLSQGGPEFPEGEAAFFLTRIFGMTYARLAREQEASYRYKVLAPQALPLFAAAEEGHWSDEKLAEYLYLEADAAKNLRRRYRMAEKSRKGDKPVDRLEIALREWIGLFAEVDEGRRRDLVRDLTVTLSLYLRDAAEAGRSLESIVAQLEGRADPDSPPAPDSGARPSWGPQWKD